MFSVYQIRLDGSLTNHETLGKNEVNTFMANCDYGYVRVVRESDKKYIDYTSRGPTGEYDIISRGFLND